MQHADMYHENRCIHEQSTASTARWDALLAGLTCRVEALRCFGARPLPLFASQRAEAESALSAHESVKPASVPSQACRAPIRLPGRSRLFGVLNVRPKASARARRARAQSSVRRRARRAEAGSRGHIVLCKNLGKVSNGRFSVKHATLYGTRPGRVRDASGRVLQSKKRHLLIK
jgi:hypothetical protein